MGHKQCWGREQGAAAVEMAIVLPILLLILFGIIDFGRLLYTKVELSSAARDGARILALQKPMSDVQQRAAASWVWQSKYPLTASSVQDCSTSDTATVKVSVPFTWITPVGSIANLFGASTGMSGTITVSSQGSMKCNL